ncbi:MAG: hypothetical protein IPQ09_08575 [Myxococcales bacterium]|nr:hypothetical protein [Myxococcales bacterium]
MPPASREADDLRAPHLYLEPRASWLEFNARVLAEAETETVPLLERLKSTRSSPEPRRVLSWSGWPA